MITDTLTYLALQAMPLDIILLYNYEFFIFHHITASLKYNGLVMVQFVTQVLQAVSTAGRFSLSIKLVGPSSKQVSPGAERVCSLFICTLTNIMDDG